MQQGAGHECVGLTASRHSHDRQLPWGSGSAGQHRGFMSDGNTAPGCSLVPAAPWEGMCKQVYCSHCAASDSSLEAHLPLQATCPKVDCILGPHTLICQLSSRGLNEQIWLPILGYDRVSIR